MLHQVHRIVCKVDEFLPASSNVYSLSKLMVIDDYWEAASSTHTHSPIHSPTRSPTRPRPPHRPEALLRNVASSIRMDLDSGGLLRGVEPPAEHRAYRRTIILACCDVDIDEDSATRKLRLKDKPFHVRQREYTVVHAERILNGDWQQGQV